MLARFSIASSPSTRHGPPSFPRPSTRASSCARLARIVYSLPLECSAPSAGFARATESSGEIRKGINSALVSWRTAAQLELRPPPSALANSAGLVVQDPDVVGGHGDADATRAEGFHERLVELGLGGHHVHHAHPRLHLYLDPDVVHGGDAHARDGVLEGARALHHHLARGLERQVQ